MANIKRIHISLYHFVGCVGALLTMQSENQVHVLSAGDSLVLDCDFHADNYNLFDYPVLWRKSQVGKKRRLPGNLPGES